VVAQTGALAGARHGGRAFEGVWDDDHYEPKRFFCHYLDEDLAAVAVEFFALESFRRIPHGWNGLHFQSLILRKRSTAASGRTVARPTAEKRQ
jgi:hypothetical protein